MLLATLALGGAPASASHFRFGQLSWTARPDVAPNAVGFTLVNAFRRDAYSGTGPDGFPVVGDVFLETVGTGGGASIDPGDGSPVIGAPLAYRVIAFDAAENWVLGVAQDPGVGGDQVLHTYPTPNDGGAPWIASFGSCCRIGALENHPNGDYRVRAAVDLAAGANSPTSSLPPIVSCPVNAVCSFLVPGADPDPGTALAFRLSTPAEDGGIPHPPGLAVDGTTGIVTWNTAGRTVGELFATQVVIEDRDAATSALRSQIGVDFLIELVPNTGSPPVFTSPVCGTTVTADAGTAIHFDVTAEDPDGGSVILNSAGVPGGATLTPGLPIAGNPASTAFDWTPGTADGGLYVVNFTATDVGGLQANCVVTLEVAVCGDGLVASTEACDDGNTVDGDCCSSACELAPPGTVCRPPAGPCDAPETCDAGICPADGFLPAGSVCRASAGGCDLAETCTGADPGCPADSFAPPGTVCRPAAGVCDLPESCDGAGPACPADLKSTALCRPAAGACDVAELCDGVSDDCPADSFAPDGTPCADGDLCNGEESCAGGICTAGTPLDCDDGNACTADGCDPALGCFHGPVVCDDGEPCNGSESCDPLLGCVAGTPLPEGADCGDGDLCNGTETCQAGACTGSAPPDCDDGNACTADSCDALLGCSNEPIPGCVDACTEVVFTEPPADPPDQNPNRATLLIRDQGTAGDTRLVAFFNPATETPELAPERHGVHLQIRQNGVLLYEVTIPGGDQAPGGEYDRRSPTPACGDPRDGWTRRTSGSGARLWLYQNLTGLLPAPGDAEGACTGDARGVQKIRLHQSPARDAWRLLIRLREPLYLQEPSVPPTGFTVDFALGAPVDFGQPSPQSEAGQCLAARFGELECQKTAQRWLCKRR